MTSLSGILPRTEKSIPLRLVAIFLLFSAGIILMGLFFYQSQKKRLFLEHADNISAVATLKIEQINGWHNERLGDAVTIRDNDPFVRSIKHFFDDPDQKNIRRELVKWMDSFIAAYDYSGISLIDTLLQDRITVASHDSVHTVAIRMDLSEVIDSSKIILTKLHRTYLPASKVAEGYSGIFEGVDYRNVLVLSYLAPVPGSPWFMVAKIDKEELLFPLKRY